MFSPGVPQIWRKGPERNGVLIPTRSEISGQQRVPVAVFPQFLPARAEQILPPSCPCDVRGKIHNSPLFAGVSTALCAGCCPFSPRYEFWKLNAKAAEPRLGQRRGASADLEAMADKRRAEDDETP